MSRPPVIFQRTYVTLAAADLRRTYIRDTIVVDDTGAGVADVPLQLPKIGTAYAPVGLRITIVKPSDATHAVAITPATLDAVTSNTPAAFPDFGAAGAANTAALPSSIPGSVTLEATNMALTGSVQPNPAGGTPTTAGAWLAVGAALTPGGGGGDSVPQNEFAYGGPGGVGLASSPNFVTSAFGILSAKTWRWFTDAGVGVTGLAILDAASAGPSLKLKSATHTVFQANLLDGTKDVRIGDNFRFEVDLETNLTSWVAPTNVQTRITGLATGTTSTPAVNPATMDATENDYALATGEFNRVAAAGGGTVLTGLVAGRDGEIRELVCTGGGGLTIRNDNAGSAAANRILTKWGTSVVLAQNGVMTLRYDGFTARWRQINTPILTPTTVAVTTPSATIGAGVGRSAAVAVIAAPEGAVYGLAAPASNDAVVPLGAAPWPSLQAVGGVGGSGGNVVSPSAVQLRFTGFDSTGAGTAASAATFNAEIVWMIAS